MQRHIQQDRARKRRRTILVIGLIAVVLVIIGVRFLSNLSGSSDITATPLSISSHYNVKPFGKYVLYYDGMSLHCVTTTGGTRWSVQLGQDADFDTDGNHVVAWSNSQLYVIDSGGATTHSDNLRSNIQFARIGTHFVGIVTGEDAAPHLYIIDLNGNPIDQEVNAYNGYMLLNMGFFGADGKYMWTLSFDVYGSVPDYTLTTFQVGQKNTGSLSLGDALVYSVLYDNQNLKVVSTRQMRTFDYRGTENIQEAALVYGWRLIDDYLPIKGNLSMLFAPETQTGAQYQVGELRLISGNTDTRYTLPSSCIGANVVDKSIYAFGDTYIYKAEAGGQHFSSWNLPGNLSAPSELIGITSDKVALLVVSDQVYALKLP